MWNGVTKWYLYSYCRFAMNGRHDDIANTSNRSMPYQITL